MDRYELRVIHVEWDQSYGGKEFWGGVDFFMQQYFSEHESF